MNKWEMPPWMHQYVSMISDVGAEGLEGTMGGYGASSQEVLVRPEGRAVAVNAQVSLLVALHARGLLKDVPPCKLQVKLTFACPDCEKSFTAQAALELGMICPCGGKIRSITKEDA